jgi:mannose-1-phosphate guanylyltransferase
MRTIPTPPRALMLAGGDGRRLRPLTRQVAGDPRPKQFCPIFDGETLLDRTRRRADLLTRLDHQVVVVSGRHEPYYAPLARELACDRVVVQPRNAGTAPGVVSVATCPSRSFRKGVQWSDWGHPQRVLATVRSSGWRPAWLERVEMASAG